MKEKKDESIIITSQRWHFLLFADRTFADETLEGLKNKNEIMGQLERIQMNLTVEAFLGDIVVRLKHWQKNNGGQNE